MRLKQHKHAHIRAHAADAILLITGQIKRGDQLIAVDETAIKGWDVKDIVGLIVGQQDTYVQLEVASLPDGHSLSPLTSPRPGH